MQKPTHHTLIAPFSISIFAILICHEGIGQESIQFSRDIQPILSEKCYHCHGPDENSREADLRLDTEQGIFADASDHQVVSPGKLEESDLYQRMMSDDESVIMPPPEAKIPLTSSEKAKIKEWIESGAKWQRLWSLVPPQKTSLPQIANRSWARNSIDVFIAAKLEANRLRPSMDASREKLLRRVYLDLVGVPPTVAQIDRFVSNDSPDAYEQVVDRLLSSPGYGERMAWPWLDAARYADSNGFQGDRERTMWPWRDWVIDALNSNMPYDEFTKKQIAGDLLPNATDEDKLATAFCRNHMINGEGGRIAEENRIEYIFDQIETVGTVWLGLTLNCCRCHDHKYDPLLQKDYYSMFAIFNKTAVNGGGGDPATPPNMMVPNRLQSRELKSLDSVLSRLRAEVTRHEAKMFELKSEQKLTELESFKALPDQIQSVLLKPAGGRDSKQLEALEKHFADSLKEYVSVVNQLRSVSDQYNSIRGSLPRVMVMADTNDRKTFRLDRGLYNQPKEEVTASLPSVFGLPVLAKTNRLTLSNWLVDPKNPLTSRVTVNRMWQQFFGVGLVKTPEDFGSQGAQPSHARLLDYLAIVFIESGWDVKAMHRMIVTSSTYRQSAVVNQESNEVDPENRLLSYSPRYRLPAWMLRDQALFVSGLMNREQSGSSVHPYQPEGIWAEATFNNKKYKQDHGGKLYRRSLYTFWRRIVGPTMLFDVAKRQTCEVKVSRTNSPLHALVTLNDQTFIEAARVLAENVAMESEELTERVRLAFVRCTSRQPTKKELKILERRYELTLTELTNNPTAAEQLLASGEFRSKTEPSIELAALANVFLLMLNLDETLSK